jgi:hypothetical protein
MSVHKPPANERERLENLLTASCSPDNDAYEDGEIEAAAAARGVDFAAWGARIKAKASAALDAEQRAPKADAAAERPDFETLLRAEVDRSVAPYEGIAPPVVVAKLRELAERYWREHPQASRILHMMHEGRSRTVSGDASWEAGDEEAEARARGRKT